MIQYLAGLFDGEGCICITSTKSKNTYILRVQVSMTHPAVKLFKEYFGGHTWFYANEKQVKKGCKPIWTWCTECKEAEEFLEKILPYLIVKKEEAELALEFRKRVDSKNHKKLTPEEKKIREQYKIGLQELKK